jgi:chorismate dehydratase
MTLLQPAKTACRAVPASVQTLGLISFINSLPVTYPLAQKAVNLEAKLLFDTPAGLNARFLNGQLTVGSMSAFFYLQQERFCLADGLSISAAGPVGSVLFFSKVEPRALCGQTVLLPDSSASAANLLKILLGEHYGVEPVYEVSADPDLEPGEASAALLIGDGALACDRKWAGRYLRIDLGQWWMDSYQLPMVFGVWAAEQDWVNKNPAAWEKMVAALNEAKELGTGELLPAVLDEAERRTGLARDVLVHYFSRQLDFNLEEAHRQGLALYGRLARKWGLL